ncbi:jg15037 [Pararge aegeria aegeria]|uniref:Jg15037 protein n=1 Tax=Pararge aegeria aegeria TaxID=348720 RepID=A0A8S4S781_9NEOP|nr:jg15037 [Pararge aegeria aegeria]
MTTNSCGNRSHSLDSDSRVAAHCANKPSAVGGRSKGKNDNLEHLVNPKCQPHLLSVLPAGQQARLWRPISGGISIHPSGKLDGRGYSGLGAINKS